MLPVLAKTVRARNRGAACDALRKQMPRLRYYPSCLPAVKKPYLLSFCQHWQGEGNSAPLRPGWLPRGRLMMAVTALTTARRHVHWLYRNGGNAACQFPLLLCKLQCFKLPGNARRSDIGVPAYLLPARRSRDLCDLATDQGVRLLLHLAQPGPGVQEEAS